MFAPPQHVKSSGSKVSPAAVSTPSTPAAAGNGDQQKPRQLKPAATGSSKRFVSLHTYVRLKSPYPLRNPEVAFFRSGLRTGYL